MTSPDATWAITALYVRHLGRRPDPEGLAFHVAAVESGRLTLKDVEAALRDSPEKPDNAVRLAKLRPLFVLHIMKTGGTSLIAGLREIAAARPVVTEIFLDHLVSIPRTQLEEATLVAGHLGYEAKRLLPERFMTCVVLRDPVDRTLSHYAHIRRDPSVQAEAPNLSLEEFVDSPRWRTLVHDYQARQLVHEIGLAGAGLEYDPAERFKSLGAPFPPIHEFPLQSFFDCSPIELSPDTLYDLAQERLASIELVGVTDRLDEVYERAARAWGLEYPSPLPHLQVTGPRLQRADVSRDLVAKIEAATEVDRALYELAARRSAA
jgi:hypothetical protein